MKHDELINLIGLALNLLGTIIAGYSAGTYLLCVHTALNAHEMSIDTIADVVEHLKGGMIVVQGLDKNRKKYYSRMQLWLNVGFIIIAIGFILQIVASPSIWEFLNGK